MGERYHVSQNARRLAVFLCWIDLFSRAVVGWSISNILASGFVCDALMNALARHPGAWPLVHSNPNMQALNSGVFCGGRSSVKA